MKLILFFIISAAAISFVNADPDEPPPPPPPPPPCRSCFANDCGLRLPEFRYSCPNGNVLDSCGCVENCLCAGCPPFNINLPCPNGKKRDANGCPLSECNCPSLQNCNLDCSRLGGYRKVDGCDTCQCAEKPGRCPRWGRWGQRCEDDYDCRGSEKCCTAGRYVRFSVCRRPYLRYY